MITPEQRFLPNAIVVKLSEDSEQQAEKQRLKFLPKIALESPAQAIGDVDAITNILSGYGCQISSVQKVFSPFHATFRTLSVAGIESHLSPPSSYSTRQRERGRHRIYRLALNRDLDVQQVCDGLVAAGAVERASPVFVKGICRSPDSARYFGFQWGPWFMECEEAWNLTNGSREIKVAIIDTGVQGSHPDLEANLLSGRTTAPKNLPPLDRDRQWIGSYGLHSPPEDVHGHGTHVTGVIGASGAVGMVGVAWLCSLVPVRAMAVYKEKEKDTLYPYGEDGWIADGVDWAVENGARVINLSLGSYGISFDLAETIQDAIRDNVIVLAAAGNDSSRSPHYPAALDGVIAVGAHDINGHIASFSNYGDRNVFICAPGVNIASTLPDSKYGTMSGTSMACPHVTGLICLMLSINPRLTLDEVKEILKNSSDGGGGFNPLTGYGKIKASKALKALTGIR